MKIFELLKRLDEQKMYYTSKGMLFEANTIADTQKRLADNYIKKEILSKKEANEAWANTDSDVSEYVNKIIELLAQLLTLSKEEIENDYDIEKIKRIYYLIHNTNRNLIKVVSGFESSDITNEGKNSDLYRWLRDYVQFIKPETLKEFEAFYNIDTKSITNESLSTNKIPVETFIAIANQSKKIDNFNQWLYENINKTLSIETLQALANFKGGDVGRSRGNYEVLLSLLIKDSAPSSGKGGDLKLGKYGAEVKASTSSRASSFGKIGGQQTSFVKDPAPVIAAVQNAVKTFYKEIRTLVPEHLASNTAIAQLDEEFGDKSNLQFSIDATWNAKNNGVGMGTKGDKWNARTIDSAVIYIINTINDVLSQDEKSVKVKANIFTQAPILIKKMLISIWSIWNEKSVPMVTKLVNAYFTATLDSILTNKNVIEHKSGRSKEVIKVDSLIGQNFYLFKKGIAFALLDIYSQTENFDFMILINSADGGKCLVLSKDSIKMELDALLNQTDNLPDVVFKTPSTFGNPGGQGVQWGIGVI